MNEIRAVYWCKDHTGFIFEHVTTPYEGHRGHLQCVPVPVGVADPAPSGRTRNLDSAPSNPSHGGSDV